MLPSVEVAQCQVLAVQWCCQHLCICGLYWSGRRYTYVVTSYCMYLDGEEADM